MWSLDENGDRAGTCYEPSLGKSVSLVVHANGATTVLDPPWSNGGGSWAGSIRNGKVVGQFYGPLIFNGPGAMSYRFHCWTWSLKEGYRQIDFPQPSTYVSCPSINKKGQVLGEYIVVDNVNNYLRHSWFIYDNGIVDADFPVSEEHLGKTAFYLADLTDDGAAIGHFWNTLTPRLVLVDDGILFDIPTPAGWLSPAPIGANAEGDFVGRYYVQTGIDPYYQWPIYEQRYFIARQEKMPRGPK